jgi:hypothetical protein
VVDIHAASFRFDETGPPQLGEVMADRRLGQAGHGGTINYLGVEVESSEKVHAEIARLAGEALVTDEQIGTTCCFATQDKVWVTGPAGEVWEVYTVLADSETIRMRHQACMLIR